MNINNKLLGYSVAAFAFLQGRNAETQVVYFDIDPDIILDSDGDFTSFDINGDAVLDFAFLNSSFTFFNSDFFSYQEIDVILAAPVTDGNAIAAFTHPYVYGGETEIRYFPYALAGSEIINSVLSWNDADPQILGMRQIIHYGEDTLHCFNCEWYGLLVNETIDGYMGIKIKDEDSNIHYGWIRCDVVDMGRTLIIKDYAYELQPNVPVLAGDTTHYVSINTKTQNTPRIYSYRNKIRIDLTNRSDPASIFVYDLMGKLIFQSDILNINSEFSLEIPMGIYNIKLYVGGQIYGKKVLIQNN
jgi:hypothetical protein